MKEEIVEQNQEEYTRKEQRWILEIMEYMNGKYSLNDVKKQIEDKTCPLPRRLRDFIKNKYN